MPIDMLDYFIDSLFEERPIAVGPMSPDLCWEDEPIDLF